MIWQEMIEAAHFDALGLLDDQERERFDAAFMKLPADLKAQLRAEQDRAVGFEIGDVLDNDAIEPPTNLKELVLSAVRTAAGKSHTVEHKAGRTLPMTKKSRAVSPMWRASSLGLVAACLVMGGVIVQLLFNVQTLSEQSKEIAQSDAFSEQFRRKPRDIAFDPKTVHVYFEPQNKFAGEATVFHHKDWEGMAMFQCLNFPSNANQTYKIVLLDKSGKAEKELANFPAAGGRKFVDVRVGLDQLARLAIVLVEANGTEAIVMTMKV